MSPTSDQTWELSETAHPASYSLFGQGCSTGASHLPLLRPDPVIGGTPVLGGTFTARIEDVPAGQPLVGYLGTSNEIWGATPLPLELGAFGWSGCHLHVSIDLVVPLGSSSSAGIGRWTLPIPGAPALVGVAFYQQVAGFDLGTTPGVFWTNGGAGTIGYQ